MDLTTEEKQKRRRSRKMLLWISMASMFMMFAGFTSAYVVSESREDWIESLGLPHIFTWSTVAIVLSSLALAFVKKSIDRDKRSLATLLLVMSYSLGIIFIILQLSGFKHMFLEGYYPMGGASTINVSFYYVIIFTHLLHVLSGLIVLTVVIYNHFKKRYKVGQTLGLELGITFWHFIDVVWIYLFLFITFLGK